MVRSQYSKLPLLALALRCFLLRGVVGSPVDESDRHGSSSPAVVASAVVDGITYSNKGLVGFGLIPSDFRESTGDTFGGVGSAIALKIGTWKQQGKSFTGTLVVQPDRGFNLDSTIDYQARRHEVEFVLNPYYGSAPLGFSAAQKTLKLKYKRTILHEDRDNVKTSGLNPLAVRPAQKGFPKVAFADPQMPIATTQEPHLTIDAEGLIANPDGSFWVSDEYGPYIYRFSASGHLIQTIQPPSAFLPRSPTGVLNFTSETAGASGRVGNQGFENLSVDTEKGILYAMLQSAAIQDGGDKKSTSRYTRLVAYDVSRALLPPRLVGEWVVPLPQDAKGNTLACSEIHFVSPGIFLALSRDGNGRGSDTNLSSYKHADLFSIKHATDIHNSAFDDPSHPIAVAGVLNEKITPATYVPFVDLLDTTQLGRFGLHNGDPNDATLIDSKWESLALAPVGDRAFPNDYFLFTAADNDFISTHGVSLGVPFNAGLDVDNQFLVFRVTLPSVSKRALCNGLGVRC